MARPKAISTPDPFAITEVIAAGTGLWGNNIGYADTGGKTLRNAAINTAVKNLVLICAGQSNRGGEAPTAYTPSNPTKLDNLNIYDGSIYAAADPMLGATWAYLSLGGSLPTPNPGNVMLRVADTLITNAKFDRVILVPIAVGGTQVAQWGTGGILTQQNNRFAVAMSRLSARGITPGMTNVTFAIEWGQGESDNGATSQVNYTTSMNQVIAQAYATAFNGRFFVAKESRLASVNDTNITNAQAAVVDSVNVFQSAFADTLTGANRLSDGTHFSDAGSSALAALIVSAFAASGAPF